MCILSLVLHRVGFLAYFCPKQGQDFKPSAAPLYQNMGQVPPTPPPSPQAGGSVALKTHQISFVHILAPEELKNEAFTHLKTHQMFSFHTTPKKILKSNNHPAILDLCLRKTGAGKSRDYRDVIFFSKSSFFKMFSVSTKTKSRRFQISPI